MCDGCVPLHTHVPLPTNLVEKAKNFSSDVLSPSLFVVENAGRRGEDDVSELT